MTNHILPWSHHAQQHAWKMQHGLLHVRTWQVRAETHWKYTAALSGTGPYILCGKSYSHQFKNPLLFLSLSSDSSRINSPSSVFWPQCETHLFTNLDGFVRSLRLLLGSDPSEQEFLKESRVIAPMLPHIHPVPCSTSCSPRDHRDRRNELSHFLGSKYIKISYPHTYSTAVWELLRAAGWTKVKQMGKLRAAFPTGNWDTKRKRDKEGDSWESPGLSLPLKRQGFTCTEPCWICLLLLSVFSLSLETAKESIACETNKYEVRAGWEGNFA